YYLAAGGMLDYPVSSVNRLRIHFDSIRRKIGKPDFWNSGPCVSRKFHKATVFERSVSDFYYQQDIGRPWPRVGIELITPTEKRQIRLRLRVIVKLDRALYTNNYV